MFFAYLTVNMQRFYTLYVVLFISMAAISQPGYQWSISSGGTKQDFARSCATDNFGNVYTAGVFSDVVDFDPGPAILTMSSTIQGNLFVTKHDSLGRLIWAKQLSGTSSQAGNISLDISGNVYLTGYFTGTVDFNPGPATFTMVSSPIGYTDIFVCKLNSDGDFIWALQTGGGNNDVGYRVTTDSNENVYVCGYFSGTSDFDPSASTYTLSSAGSSDCFIWKLSPQGSFIWAKSISGVSYDVGYALEVTTDNYLFISGISSGTADFDPGAGQYTLTSKGYSDVFIGKYTLGGELLWAKMFGGDGDDVSKDLTIDYAGNIIVCGYFLSTRTDFDPGSDSCIKNSTFGQGFVTKFDSLGNFKWAHQFGSSNSSVNGIASNENKIYFTGTFSGSSDFDPGPSSNNLSANGGHDVFICQLNQSGSFDCAASFGAINGNDVGASISVFQNSMYVSGHFSDVIDFDPSALTSGHISNGNTDMFVCKFRNCDQFVFTPENENTFNDIKIFPNPSSHFIFQNSQHIEYNAVLFSNTGALLNTFTLKNNDSLNLEKYPKGIYFLKLYSGGKTYMKKIVVE